MYEVPSSYYNTQTSYTQVDEGTYRSYYDAGSESYSYNYNNDYYRPSYNYGGGGYQEVHHHHHHGGSTYTYTAPQRESTDGEKFIGLCIIIGVVGVGICLVIAGIEDAKRKEEERKKRQAAIEAYCNNPENEKKFFREPLSVFGAPADPEFGILTQHTPALRRKVEVFQWEEHVETIRK